MEKEGWLCLCGCAPFTYAVFCARETEESADEGITASGFYSWDENDAESPWIVYDFVAAWRAQSMATIKPAGGERVLVAIGANGQYFEVEPKSLEERNGTIPDDPGPLRRLAAIDDIFIAVGMGRTVLQRKSLGQWQEIGPGISDADADQIVGFEGIGGFTIDDLYVAGWHGEMWRRTKGEWHQVDSPTNANLNALACASDGKVYAVGDNGSMIVGSGEEWDILESGRSENLQDVAEFDGQVYVVTDFRILRLTEEGLVSEDRFKNGDQPDTCLSLLKAADGIVMLGPKDIFKFTKDEWERIY